MPPIQNQVQPPGYGGYPQPAMTPLPSHGGGFKLLPLTIILGVLFVFTLMFGFWAFGQMQDYKNNSDKKSAAAVSVAEAAQETKLNAEFAEKEKSPYKTYQSTADFGSVKIVYPKIWGAYIEETSQGSSPVNGYFNPNFVPKIDGQSPIALRVQVLSTAYQSSLQEFEGMLNSGQVKASPIAASGVKGVTGMRFDGKIAGTYSGSVVLFPLRDKTLKIWTEIPANVSDLNNIVLKNLTFVP
jgi:cytoskeletal protein RodZ